ncbi:glycosyltransferase family 2 protein, partial [Campylobacter jejuni]|nr:glycosyltransferase family 2 protein [Campylobacter jejuni]
MKEERPLVSIIIPIYNVEKYLKECLDSVIHQTYRNLDIILVDDGSIDGSIDIALKYLNKDKRIFLISKKNGGLSSARNTGLEFIKGTKLRSFFENKKGSIISLKETHSLNKNTKILEIKDIDENFKQINKNYITTNLENINEFIIQEMPNSIVHFLDSDDYLSKDCIELCVRELIKKKLDICLHGFSEFIEKQSKFIERPKSDLAFRSEKYYYKKSLDLLIDNNFLQFYFAWQGIFKVNVLNNYNLRFIHGIYHEDHDFGTILFTLAHKLFYLDKILMIYRIREGSITNSKGYDFPNQMPKKIEQLKKYFTTYFELREYFKAYSLLKTARSLYIFNKNFKKK